MINKPFPRVRAVIFMALLITTAFLFLSVPTATAQSTREACEDAGRQWIDGPGCVGSAAQAGGPCEPGGDGLLGFPTWYEYVGGLRGETGRCEPVVDLKNPAHIGAIAIAILDILLRLAGILAAIFVIVGGFKYILSQGNPESAASARKSVINALVGLAITIVATGLVTFIGNQIGDS